MERLGEGRYIKRYLDFWISGYYSISPLAICDGGYFLFIGKPNKHFFTQDLVHILCRKEVWVKEKLSDLVLILLRTHELSSYPHQGFPVSTKTFCTGYQYRCCFLCFQD